MFIDVHNQGKAEESHDLAVQRQTVETEQDSVLFTEWEWSSDYVVLNGDQIFSPIFVMSIKKDTSCVIEALPIDAWAAKFTTDFYKRVPSA